jgi:hypothetical protein
MNLRKELKEYMNKEEEGKKNNNVFLNADNNYN